MRNVVVLISTLLQALAIVISTISFAIAGEDLDSTPNPPPGARAIAEIDWTIVDTASNIPHQMPVGDADSAIDSGFASQWIERALEEAKESVAAMTPMGWVRRDQMRAAPAAELALKIAASDRLPDDRWAHEVARKLRETARINGDANVLRYMRVFCGSNGCLCYLEAPNPSPSSDLLLKVLYGDIFKALMDKNGWGQAFGIKPLDVYQAFGARSHIAWQLIYVVRSNPTRQ